MRGFVISLFLLIALACVASTGAQRKRGPTGFRKPKPFQKPRGGRSSDGRRKPSKEQPKDKYEWEVDMGMNNTVTQKAFAKLEEGEVVVMTVGRELNKLGLRPSAVYLNVKTGVMAISGRRGPCFLTSTSETNVTVENDLMSWNGTEISMSNSVNLTGTAEPQDVPEELVKANPGLRRVCGGRRPRVINATLMESNGDAGDVDTEIIKTLGYDAEISILVRSRAQKKEDRAEKKEDRRAQKKEDRKENKGKGPRGGQRKGPRGGNQGQGNNGRRGGQRQSGRRGPGRRG